MSAAHVPGYAGAEMAPTCTPRCMHAAGPAADCRCAICGGLAHGIAPWPADQQLSLFDVATPAPQAGPAACAPAAPPSETTYNLDFARPAAAGQIDNMGAAADGRSLVAGLQNGDAPGPEVTDDHTGCDNLEIHRQPSALSSVSPANPDPQGTPAPDAAGGDRSKTETKTPITNASQTDAGSAPGSAPGPAVRRCSCGRLAAPFSLRCERCHPLRSLRALRGFGT